MSTNQRFGALLEESFSQKYNFGDKIVPHGTTLDEYLKSTAFLESTPNNFAFSCPGPRNVSLNRQFEQYVGFSKQNPDSPPIQNSIFPLFCHIFMRLKQKDDSSILENFIQENLIYVPEEFRQEANLFVSDDDFYKKMSCLFSTQQYKIPCDIETAEKIKEFLFKSGHSQLRILYSSIIILTPMIHQRKDRTVYPIFPLRSPTSSMSIVQARINSASLAAISNDDPTVYACCNDQNILKIDTASQKVTNLYTHNSSVTTLSLSHMSKILLTADICGNISLWSPQASCSLNTKFTQFFCSAFAPHGGIFATGTGSGLIHLYDTPKQQLRRILIGHQEPVTNVAFHPNCALMGSLALEPAIRIWDLRQPETVRLFVSQQSQKNSALAFSNDGKSIVVFDGELNIYDIGTQKLVLKKCLHVPDINALHFSMDSRYLYAVGQQGDLISYELTTDNNPTKEIIRLNERVIFSEILKADEFRIVTSYENESDQ
ncbi:hypothetical protein TRFO_29106 [Tritrichomonas foetus]|uniref:TFIID subunit TAF5 NTD2 domain-containing protein n=1 Tax=Tritrichomonas foetus TaxID=1144522 RepID=A0A1J4JXU7_9EUKA|nr:hypothetical protein TRFO_29106 [Tritrichomonas foetus]|eukprot:OHT03506.1 hypothetical protein TRFO_29106 [Tritrichomonas foetus]